MAEAPKVPDQFYKSRLACFTLSTLAFAASIVSDKNLDEMVIFGIKGSSIDHNFIVLCLIIGATVSLASVIFLYVDDVATYIRYTITNSASRMVDELSDDTRKILETIRENSTTLKNYLINSNLKDILAKGSVTIKNDEAERVVDSLFRSNELVTIIDQIGLEITSSKVLTAAIEAAEMQYKSEIAVIRHEQTERLQSIKNALVDKKENLLLRFSDPKYQVLWDGPSIDQFIKQLESYQEFSINGVNRLIRELDGYNRVIRRAGRARRVEYAYIGVGAPTFLFVIAFAHCWGRLFGGPFYTLPALVKLSLP